MSTKKKYKISTGRMDPKKLIRANGLLLKGRDEIEKSRTTILDPFPSGFKFESLLVEAVSNNPDDIETDILPDLFPWMHKQPSAFTLLVLSPKFQTVLASLNTHHHSLFDTDLLLLRGTVTGHKVLHITELPFLDYIDFTQTVVQNGEVQRMFSPETVIKEPQNVDSYEHLLEVAKGKNWPCFDIVEFHAKEAFWHDDFMFLANHGFLVSERFIHEIEKANITGIEYKEVDLNLRVIPLN